MKSRTLTALLPAFALALHIACADKGAETTSTDSQPVSARVSQVNYQTVPGRIEVPGTVQPRNRIMLSAQLNGFVRDMHVRVGDTVKQNQLLATLDARDAEAQRAAALAAVSAAEAALAEARKSYRSAADMRTAAKAASDLTAQTLTRYQKLYEARSVSPQEIDEVRTRHNTSIAEFASREAMVSAAEDRIRQAEARIEEAKAQAARAEVMMSWTTIKAPADGRVVQRQADPGTAIFPGTPILVIESTARPQASPTFPAAMPHCCARACQSGSDPHRVSLQKERLRKSCRCPTRRPTACSSKSIFRRIFRPRPASLSQSRCRHKAAMRFWCLARQSGRRDSSPESSSLERIQKRVFGLSKSHRTMPNTMKSFPASSPARQSCPV